MISLFLLCLLLTINWHNSILHSHQGEVKGESNAVHQHSHDHHPDHHHGADELALWDWLAHLLGDFNHPDQGEKHFEIFLNPGYQIGIEQPGKVVDQPYFYHVNCLQSLDSNTDQNREKPNRVLSFSDPPFFDSLSNRGPPTFS